MNRLSRKRNLPKSEPDPANNSQTKISQFFSKPLFTTISESKKPRHSAAEPKLDSPLPVVGEDSVLEAVENKSDEDIIDRTPEIKPKKSRYRFSRSSLHSSKSSLQKLVQDAISLKRRKSDTEIERPTVKKIHKTSDDSIRVEENSICDDDFKEVPTVEDEDIFDKSEAAAANELFDDDLEAFANSSPIKLCGRTSPEPPPTISSQFNRSKVVSVDQSDPREWKLDLESSNVHRTCLIRGSWLNCSIRAGDIVNVLTDFNEALDAYVIDDANGLLVVNPDQLISGTSVVSSLFCMRKAVLNERYKGLEGTSKTMFIGTLVHELLQECLKQKISTETNIKAILDDLLHRKNMLHDIWTLDMTISEVHTEVEPFLSHILFFTRRYVLGDRTCSVPRAAFAGSQSRPPPPPVEWPGQVDRIRDIEENIWSPRLGLKGKVDLTVEVKLHNRDKKNRIRKTVPLELKTGRPSGSVEHRGQVILYSMMMSERREDPESGLLLYLRTSSLQEIPAGIHEMRGLIQLRNQLVANILVDNVDEEAPLPEPLNLKRACEQCPHLTVCAAHQRMTSSIPATPHAMADLVPTTLEHLTDKHIEFFKRWSFMCSLESAEGRKGSRTKNLWCQTPIQREQRSLAIAGLELDGTANDLRHVFKRDTALPCSFQVGETVLVSSESELALSQGIVTSINDKSIDVILDRDLCVDDWRTKRFHIDRYEYVGGMSSSLVNLAKLMSSSASHLRSLVVDRQPVSFSEGLPKDVLDHARPIMRPLNRVQQKAIFKTLMANDYALLKGMPGTGKTTVIVALVRLLVSLGKSVLLTSYTHTAVDNILLKLLESGSSEFVRLGRVSRIHPRIVPHSADRVSASGLDHLKSHYAALSVVATTCLGLNHPAVTQRTFDYCIVDEAGQSMLLASLGPLFHAKKFVLVGDPEQLPPIVQNEAARSLGMDCSLFSHLETKDNTLPLTIQYRMNEVIMDCANHMTYKGALTSGGEEVKTRTLMLSTREEPLSPWLEKAMSPALADSIVFCDTSDLDAFESVDEHGVCNPVEADIVTTVVQELLGRGVRPADIGVIAPYRAQVNLLRGRLSVETNTVDQFQGRDKQAIVYSCTRSKAKEAEATEKEILADERRLNVAITRAKCKFVMIGNSKTLKSYSPLRKLLEYLEQHQKCVLKPFEMSPSVQV